MPLHYPALLAKPKKFKPSEFFERTIRRALEDRREAATVLGGVVVFELTGKDGGVWTIDLSQATVEPGPTGLADTTLSMPAETFCNAVTGRGRVHAGDIKTRGEKRAGEALTLLVAA